MRILFIVTALVFTILTLSAQEPQDTAPALYEAEQLRVQLVKLTDQLATCQSNINKNHVSYLSSETLRQIETAHPGWTLDWDTGGLVKKATPPTVPSVNKEK